MGCVSISWSPRRSVYDEGMDRYSKTFAALQGQSRSVRLLNYIRPNILATPFYTGISFFGTGSMELYRS